MIVLLLVDAMEALVSDFAACAVTGFVAEFARLLPCRGVPNANNDNGDTAAAESLII